MIRQIAASHGGLSDESSSGFRGLRLLEWERRSPSPLRERSACGALRRRRLSGPTVVRARRRDGASRAQISGFSSART